MYDLWLHFVLPLAIGIPLFIAVANRVWPSFVGRLDAVLGPSGGIAAAVVLLMLYALGLASCTITPMALDHIEVSVGSIAYVGLHGSPVYTALDDARRYSLLYGPLCYLPYEGAMAVLGASIRSLKIAVVVLNVTLFLLLWMTFRKVCKRWVVLLPLAFIAAGMTLEKMSPFLIRGDTILAIGVTVALLALNVHRREAAVALFALGCACAFDVKITAVFYLLLPLYLFARKYGYILASVATALVCGLALLPFRLRQFSLRYYADWLREATHHPLDAQLFDLNVMTSLILLAPLLLILASAVLHDRARALALLVRNKYLLVVFGVSLIGSVLTGSKLGAGPTHLSPWFILAMYLAVCLGKQMPTYASAFLRRSLAIVTLVMMIPAAREASELCLLAQRARGWAIEVNADLEQILLRHRGKGVAMTYEMTDPTDETTDPLNSFALQLVLAGNPLLLDEGALDDMQLSGLTIPEATRETLKGCRIPVWLSVKGEPPLTTRNVYARWLPSRFPQPLLFDDEFHTTFFRYYKRTASSRFYDLWTCDPAA